MLPPLPDFSLSVEQQFDLQKYRQQVRDISREDLEDLFIEVVRQKMAHENIFKGMIRKGG